MNGRWGGEIAADALLREGVTSMFGLTGGHLQSLQDFAYRAGIDLYQMRHEQAGIYAADAYARTSRRPGVAFGTAGPGMLNMAAGIHMAYLAGSPVVCLLGGHKQKEADRGTLQEADAVPVLSSITKWTKRCHTVDQVSFYIRKAFRDAMTPPYGPVAIEFPLDAFNWEPTDPSDQVAYLPGPWRASQDPRTAPDPRLLAEVARLVGNARRPLLIAGDGVHWDHAEEALARACETLELPVNLRRMSRGAIREDGRLSVPSAARRAVFEEADLIVTLGLDVGYFESFGNWRTDATIVQVSRTASDIALHLPTAVEVRADTASFLNGLVDLAGDERLGAAARTAWVERIGTHRTAHRERIAGEAAEHAHDVPLHPRTIAQAIVDQLPPDMPVVLDSFTGSAFLSSQTELSHTGQMIDSGLSGAIGHGIGMGIGASVATDNGPVFVLMGDGGVGIGSGDIEAAVRFELPIVYLIYNNGGFCAGLESYAYGEDFSLLGPKARGGFNFTQGVRYDQMFAPLGCHVEHVETPGGLREAINRALASGITAVINVVGTRDVHHPLYHSAQSKEMFWHLPPDEVEAPARERHIEHHYPKFH